MTGTNYRRKSYGKHDTGTWRVSSLTASEQGASLQALAYASVCSEYRRKEGWGGGRVGDRSCLWEYVRLLIESRCCFCDNMTGWNLPRQSLKWATTWIKAIAAPSLPINISTPSSNLHSTICLLWTMCNQPECNLEMSLQQLCLFHTSLKKQRVLGRT
jgi:hypothetical protein